MRNCQRDKNTKEILILNSPAANRGLGHTILRGTLLTPDPRTVTFVHIDTVKADRCVGVIRLLLDRGVSKQDCQNTVKFPISLSKIIVNH